MSRLKLLLRTILTPRNRIRLPRPGPRALWLLSSSYLLMCCALAAQVTVNTGAGNGNGVLMTEGSSAISTPALSDSIFADSSTHRVKIINNGGSALVLATWPCVTVGCIPYGTTVVNTVAPETSLAGNTSGTAMLTENSSGTPAWVLAPLNTSATTSMWLNSYNASTGAFGQSQPGLSDLTATFSAPLSLSGNTLSIAGYSIPWFTVSGPVPASAVTFSGTSNRETLWGVVLTFPLTTTQITYDVGTADTSGTHQYGLGILNSSGTVVVHIGPTAGSTLMTSGFHTVNWVEGSTTLQPGKYYLVITSSCTSTCAALAGANSNIMTFLNASVQTITTGGTVQSVSAPADTYSVAGNVPAFVAQ